MVVLIARSEKTGRQSLVRTRDILKKVRANIAGVVVNDLSFNSVEYRQYYGHYGSEYLTTTTTTEMETEMATAKQRQWRMATGCLPKDNA